MPPCRYETGNSCCINSATKVLRSCDCWQMAWWSCSCWCCRKSDGCTYCRKLIFSNRIAVWLPVPCRCWYVLNWFRHGLFIMKRTAPLWSLWRCVNAVVYAWFNVLVKTFLYIVGQASSLRSGTSFFQFNREFAPSKYQRCNFGIGVKVLSSWHRKSGFRHGACMWIRRKNRNGSIVYGKQDVVVFSMLDCSDWEWMLTRLVSGLSKLATGSQKWYSRFRHRSHRIFAGFFMSRANVLCKLCIFLSSDGPIPDWLTGLLSAIDFSLKRLTIGLKGEYIEWQYTVCLLSQVVDGKIWESKVWWKLWEPTGSN